MTWRNVKFQMIQWAFIILCLMRKLSRISNVFSLSLAHNFFCLFVAMMHALVALESRRLTRSMWESECVCKTHSDHSILSINQCRVHRACTQHIYIQFIRSLVRSQILNSRVEIVMYVDVNVDAIIHTHNQNHTTHFRHYIEMNFVSCVRAKDFDHWMRHCVRTLRKKGDFLSLSLLHPFSDRVHFDILSFFSRIVKHDRFAPHFFESHS